MKLEDLQIFMATVQAGSFTRAADKLLLTKQHVSRRIDALEQDLGVALFMRNSRGLRITELGNEFRQHASRILDTVDSAARAMSESSGKPRGTLRISSPVSFGVRYLSPRLAEFMRENPEVQLQVVANDVLTDPIDGDFDAAVRLGKLPDSSLVASKLGDMPVVACCSADYIRCHGEPSSPAELAGHPCLLYGKEPQTGWTFSVDGAPVTETVGGPLFTNNGEFIMDAAIAGRGIAYMPLFIVEQALRTGQLVPILEAYQPAPLQISVVYPQHHQQSLLMHTFLDFMKKSFAALQPRGMQPS